MRPQRWIACISLLSFLIEPAFAVDPATAPDAAGTETPATQPTNEDSEPTEQQQVGEDAVSRVLGLVKDGIDKDLANQAANAIKALIKNTRADQASIYTFVRTVNRNLDKSRCTADHTTEVRRINRQLMSSSYTDQLFQNGNLSNQIMVRLPLLIEDSVKLGLDGGRAPCDDFLQELTLLSDRFLASKRFRAGLGLSYSYLPKVSYMGNQRIDYSAYQSTISGGSDLLQFKNEFANFAYPSLSLSAQVPYMRVDANFSNAKETRTTITPVQFRDIDETDTDILSRSTVTSDLHVEFELSAKASLTEIWEKMRSSDNEPVRERRFDLGFGIGLTGFRVEDSVSTDIRFRTDDSSFEELPVGATLTSSSTNSFNTPFLVADLALKISDELHAAFEFRYYDDGTSSNREVSVDGVTMSLAFVWYPTFPW